MAPGSSPEGDRAADGGEEGHEDEAPPSRLPASPTTSTADHALMAPVSSPEEGARAVDGGEEGHEDEAPSPRLLASPTISTSDHAPASPGSSPEEGVPAVDGCEEGKEEAPPPRLPASLTTSTTDHAPATPVSSPEEGARAVDGGEEGKEGEATPPRLLASPTTSTADDALAAPIASQEEGSREVYCEAGLEDEPPSPQEAEGEQEEAEEDGSAEAGEEEEDDDDDDKEVEEEEGKGKEAPTHLPFPPSSEPESREDTTIDPSSTISLIRKILLKGSNENDFTFGFIQSEEHVLPEERDASSDDRESTQPDHKDSWETSACRLWDLSVIKPQADLMMNNLVLDVLLENLRVTQSPRVKQICIGILGNLASDESHANAITLHDGLISTVVDQLFLDDSDCLSETFRLLAAIFRSNSSISWAEALLPDEILSRVLWIIGNTLNSTLLERTIDFLSTLFDDQDVITILIGPLINAGLVDGTISLLTTEIETTLDGNKLDRSNSLDLIFRFIEELSAIDNCSELMSLSDQLIKALVSIVKLPDKFEVASYYASVVIILANVLADGKHLAPWLSHDVPLLEGLFDILPLVSDDNQARHALWCILQRLLAQVHAQETVMNSSTLEQFTSLFLGRFPLIKDDIETNGIDTSGDPSIKNDYLKNGVSTSLRAICRVVERWIAEKSSLSKEVTSQTEDTIENARKLLSYCRKYKL